MTLFTLRPMLSSAMVTMVAAWISTIPSAGAAVIGFINQTGQEIEAGTFDNFWIDRLETQGHTIIRGDDDIEFDDALYDAVDMFIVSDSVLSAKIGDRIDTTGLSDPRPVVMYETGAMDNYKIGDGEAYRWTVNTDVDTRIMVITDPSSPLAGGFTEPVQVYDFGITFGPSRLHGVRGTVSNPLAPGLQTVATSVPSSNVDPFFLPFIDGAITASDTLTTLGFVPQGGELNDGTLAAGLRIIAFFNDTENPNLAGGNMMMNADGIALMDATISFALDLPVGPMADFDGDLDVDGNDFLEWQRGFGTTFDANDLANWQAEFGTPSSVAATSSVPEPASWLLVCLMTMTICARCRPH